MSLGMVVRCDNGGLGTMTWEAWRHLRPTRTLVVRTTGPACGTPTPGRYDVGAVRYTPTHPTVADARWLCEGVDIIYGAETWYRSLVTQVARRQRVRTALHVMPEYWMPDIHADLLLAPTPWQAPPDAQLLPVPVARDRLTRRRIDGVDTIYHVASPAQDRNGTQLLLAALEELRRPCRVLIRQPGRHRSDSRHEIIGKAHVEWLPHHNGPYWEAWPEHAQALVMPRRFAGLSLPMQEAAALGLPVITLDRAPESDWFPGKARVKAAAAGRVVTWRACRVDLWDAAPGALAETIDELTTSPALAQTLAEHSSTWADTLAWPRWVDTYRQALS